jgi:hypothetical protein
MRNSFLILILLSLLGACGSPVTSRVEISSKLSFLSTDHEIIFIGKHYVSDTKFSLNVENDGFDMDIPRGKWEFALIAWQKDGSGRFTGTTKCQALSNVDVQGESIRLNFSISTAGCDHEFFRRSGFLASNGEFQDIKIKSCTELSNITESSSTCTPVFTSYRLIVKPQNARMNTTAPRNDFISDCYLFNNSTSLKFPAFGVIPLNLEIEAHTNSTCSAFGKRYLLPKGLNVEPGLSRVFDNADTSVVFIGDQTPAIIAINTVQTSLSTIPPTGNLSRSLTFRHSDHYSGSIATSCSAPNPTYTTVDSCNCDAMGLCTLNFTVNNLSGASIDKIIFQYNLTDGTNASNTATAISCSGFNNSCTN